VRDGSGGHVVIPVRPEAAVKLTVVGCSPAWPNPGGAQSGYLLEGAGSLLVDCGPGVLGRLRELGRWPELDAIAITHFHLDHWGDLVPWVWGTLHTGFAPPGPELWVPSGGQAVLREFGRRLGFVDMFERTFRLREFKPGRPFRAGGFNVTGLRMPHYNIESYGFRVADGKVTVAYSGDCAPSPELVALAHEADLFVCEATLSEPASDGVPRGHLTLAEAKAAFHGSCATRLLVVHRPAELPAPGVELAYDGMVVEL
jgi:ribonuclease BN (tRNA processing enzyme)